MHLPHDAQRRQHPPAVTHVRQLLRPAVQPTRLDLPLREPPTEEQVIDLVHGVVFCVQVDTRFAYCALSTSTLIGKPDCIDRARIVKWIDACKNFDGGYGSDPGGESHAGQVFTCVGGLAVSSSLSSPYGRFEY